MFPLGTQVKLTAINTASVPAAIVTLLKGKVGVVVANKSHNWDYVVQFTGTPRPDGLYGFFDTDIELA